MSARIDVLPTPPSRSDSPTDFVTKGDAFLGKLPTFQVQVNALADEVQVNATGAAANATAAFASEQAAAASATAASATANVTKWVSGTVYVQGANVWSPTDFQTYRRKVAGSGAADPKMDTANWSLVSGAQLKALLDMTAITNITYFSDNTLNTLTYATGHRVAVIYSGGNVANVKYYDTDGVTLLYTETFNYTGSNLTSSTWT